MTMKKRDTHGNPLIFIDAPPVRFFGGPDEWCTVVFPVEARAYGQGEVADPSVLSLCLRLTEQQAAWVEAVEAVARLRAHEHGAAWLGKAMTPEQVAGIFVSSVRREEPHPPLLKVRLSVRADQGAEIRVVGGRGQELARGSGLPFVLSHQGPRKWQNAQARVVLQAQRLWFVSRKLGVHFCAHMLQLCDEGGGTFADPFA
jgi:hypothetical protein